MSSTNKVDDFTVSTKYAQRIRELESEGTAWLQEKNAPRISPQIDVTSTIQPEAEKFIGANTQSKTFASYPTFPYEQTKTRITAFQNGSLASSIEFDTLNDRVANAPPNLKETSFSKVKTCAETCVSLNGYIVHVKAKFKEFTPG